MNKIKVNMAVEPNDIQTLHCSQYDTEERKFSVDLHENGVGVSPSSISNQLVYKSFKGGTEQILPVNTSTPSTSPIIADIQYKDGLREDEEFLYRESPSDVDGYAKIKEIRGNTLVWNQLVDSGTSSVTLTSGHIYITRINGTATRVSGTGQSVSVTGGTDNVFDLTKMYGSGNEPSTAEEFTSLYPLPYYNYDSGSLLSFNGTGIKTTGKNLCIRTNENSNIYNADNLIPVKQGDEIWVYADYSTTGSNMWTAIYTLQTETNKNNYIAILGYIENGTVKKITITNDGYFGIAYGSGVSTYTINKIMIARTSFAVDDYEPYTSSTLSLPISTYFPTGLKSAGSVYDELNEANYITRVGEVDLGNLAWSYIGSAQAFYAVLNGVYGRTSGTPNNAVCAKYEGENVWLVDDLTDKHFFIRGETSTIYIKDTSYSDATTFGNSLSGVYLCFELDTETSVGIKTASIVTNYGEMPLYNDNGDLKADCIADVSQNSGFQIAKVKLKDENGEIYSNPFQIHTERSPQ